MGPFLIMLSASLWAIDALFRTQLTFTIPPASIVFLEHLIGFVFLSPILLKQWRRVKTFESQTWLLLILMTIISSVAGTLLFTQALNLSFAENDFVTPILLQKLQPIFVVLLSALILKEKITGKFISLAIVALVGSYLLSFGTNVVQLKLAGKELVVIMALGAAVCWGGGTIISKALLNKIPFELATSLRFLLAIPVALIASIMINQTYDFTQLGVGEIWRFIVIAGLTGGAGALYLYYKGLETTDAKVSTFAELMLPVVSIFIAITPLNPYGEAQTLSGGNIVGIVLLIGSIVMISLRSQAQKAR